MNASAFVCRKMEVVCMHARPFVCKKMKVPCACVCVCVPAKFDIFPIKQLNDNYFLLYFRLLTLSEFMKKNVQNKIHIEKFRLARTV